MMGLFSGQRRDRAGAPGQRNGFLCFWDQFIRDGWNWYFAGFLLLASALPYMAGLIVSVDNLSAFPMLITAPLGGMLAAPQVCGLADTLLRSFRDEDPPSWWRSYRKSWRRNWKATLFPGAVFGSILSIQIFTLNYAITVTADLAMICWVALSMVITTAILTFFIALNAAVEGHIATLLRNAVILCFHKPLRTLAALLIQIAYWGLICWFYPRSLPVFIIFQFWLPTSIAMSVIYPPLEKAYDLETRLQELHGSKENE